MGKHILYRLAFQSWLPKLFRSKGRKILKIDQYETLSVEQEGSSILCDLNELSISMPSPQMVTELRYYFDHL